MKATDYFTTSVMKPTAVSPVGLRSRTGPVSSG